MQNAVKLEKIADGTIAILTINNPPVNALNKAVREAMLAHLEALREEIAREASSVKVVVIKGSSSGFSAGADLRHEMLPCIRRALAEEKDIYQFAHVASFLGEGHSFIDTVATFPIYTIACIDGYALGGGFELALACDERLVTHSAKIGLPETTLDLWPGWGGTARLADIMGDDSARKFYEKGEPISGCRAKSLGLASRCFDSAEDALALMRHLVQSSQSSPLLEKVAFQKRARPLRRSERNADMVMFFNKIVSGDPEWKIITLLNSKSKPRVDEATGFLIAEDGTILIARRRKNFSSRMFNYVGIK